MSRRLTPLLLALASLAAAAAPASAAPAGATFLTGGLELPAGAVAGAHSAFRSNLGSFRSSVSADGRYVAFVSEADTFDPAAHPDVLNVFRKDRESGEVVLVSRASGADGAAPAFDNFDPVISADGSRVAFWTRAALDPLADTDVQPKADVYVRDVEAGTTALASRGDDATQTADDVIDFDLSGDGEHVAFTTSARLVPALDGNTRTDVYARDLDRGATELVSTDAAGTGAGDFASRQPSISDDGSWVAFVSDASNLVTGYTPGTGEQAFARDMALRANATQLVSAKEAEPLPTVGSNGAASDPAIAGAPSSGAPEEVFVAYTSTATNLAQQSDAFAVPSVYRRQLSPLSPTSQLVSRADNGMNANRFSGEASISDAGDRVAFTSFATNLEPAGRAGIYVRDVDPERTVLGSNTNGRFAALSGDGTFLLWSSPTGITADSDLDLGGAFGRSVATDLTLGSFEFVSRPKEGTAFLATAFEVAQGDPGEQAVSGDGRYIVFDSTSARLPGGRPGGPRQIYRRDLATGAITLVSQSAGGATGDGFSVVSSISADGTRVVFRSSSRNLVATPTTLLQAYVRDLAARTTTLVSRAEGIDGAAADQEASAPRLSPDGGFVTFVSRARNLGVVDGLAHVYLRDVAGGHTTLVDRATGDAGAVANGGLDDDFVGARTSVSAQGRRVAFASRATNLDPDDADPAFDVYVRDTVANTTTLVSRRAGLAGQHAAGTSRSPSISADGSVVAFTATDEALVPASGPWFGHLQVVARTLATGENALVSRAPDDAPANAAAESPSVDGDGSVIAFQSRATNLIPGVGGFDRDAVFARTMAPYALSGPPAFGIDAQHFAMLPSISGDGQCLAFLGRGHNAVSGLADDMRTTYMHVVSGECPKPLPPDPGPAPRPDPDPRPAPDPSVDPPPRAAPPAFTRTSLSSRRIRVGRRVTIAFALSVGAEVSIVAERSQPGRRSGGSCRKPAAKLRRRPRCVRWVAAGTVTRRSFGAGRSSVAFSGRIGRRALPPGSYRLTLTARNDAGVSGAVRLPFTVVRR